jgi:hypothetical protein
MKLHWRILTFIVFSSLLTVSGLSGQAFGDCASSQKAQPSYQNIQTLIHDCNVTSIDQLLPLLPESYKSSFTLMRTSKSLQEASGDYPRAILFGTDAKFIITFNGNPNQKGYNNLEVIQWSDQAHSFSFDEIQFSKDARSVPIFRANPHECTACHRDPPRPNWQSYDFWEGAYGQAGDQIKVGSQEDHAFQSFLKNSRDKGRYQFLTGKPGLKGPSEAEIEKGTPDPTAYSVATLPNFRLTFFLDELNYQRIAAQLKDSPNFSQYKYAIYGALYGCDPIDSFLPNSVTATFPMSYQQVLADTLNKLSAQYNDRIHSSGPVDSFGQDGNGNDMPSDFEANNASKYIIAKLRYIMENRGIKTQDWSLSSNPDAYTFSDGENYLKEVARSFKQDLGKIPELNLNDDYVNLNEDQFTDIFGSHAQDFKGLRRLSCCAYDGVNDKGMSNQCRAIQKLSLAQFATNANGVPCDNDEHSSSPAGTPVQSMLNTSGAILRSTPPPLLNTCIGCHVNGYSGAPSIPFNDLPAFAAALKKPMSKNPSKTLLQEIKDRIDSGSMPKDIPISASEKAALESYFSSLAK